MSTRVVVNTDGAALGNPGPAGAGYVLQDETGRELRRGSQHLGVATNNVAEYEALLMGLTAARSAKAREVVVRMDSELVVKQMTGQYRVKHPGLRPYFERAVKAVDTFGSVIFEHVGREQNKEADRLASDAAYHGPVSS